MNAGVLSITDVREEHCRFCDGRMLSYGLFVNYTGMDPASYRSQYRSQNRSQNRSQKGKSKGKGKAKNDKNKNVKGKGDGKGKHAKDKGENSIIDDDLVAVTELDDSSSETELVSTPEYEHPDDI